MDGSCLFRDKVLQEKRMLRNVHNLASCSPFFNPLFPFCFTDKVSFGGRGMQVEGVYGRLSRNRDFTKKDLDNEHRRSS